MKQRILLIVVSCMFVFAGLCANAYATPVPLDLSGATLDFYLGVDDQLNPPVAKLTRIEAYPEPGNDTNPITTSPWYPLGLTNWNWGEYQLDEPDIAIPEVYKYRNSARTDLTDLIPGLSFEFYDIFAQDGFSFEINSPGTGMMHTADYGAYTFDYTAERVACEEINIHTSNFNPVPEPATMLLVGCGLLGIAGVSRKKTQKTS